MVAFEFVKVVAEERQTISVGEVRQEGQGHCSIDIAFMLVVIIDDQLNRCCARCFN